MAWPIQSCFCRIIQIHPSINDDSILIGHATQRPVKGAYQHATRSKFSDSRGHTVFLFSDAVCLPYTLAVGRSFFLSRCPSAEITFPLDTGWRDKIMSTSPITLSSSVTSPARSSQHHLRRSSTSSLESEASSVFIPPATQSTSHAIPIQNQFARVSLASSSSSLVGWTSSPSTPSTPALSSHLPLSASAFNSDVRHDGDDDTTIHHHATNTTNQAPRAANLPAELLLAIFAHLPADPPAGPRHRATVSTLYAATLVCKKWFAPATSMLWRRVSTMADDFEAKVKPVVSRVNKLLKDYRRDIVSLEVRATSAAWASGVLKLGGIRRALGGCLALRTLDIDVPCLKDDDLVGLGGGCEQKDTKSASLLLTCVLQPSGP